MDKNIRRSLIRWGFVSLAMLVMSGMAHMYNAYQEAQYTSFEQARMACWNEVRATPAGASLPACAESNGIFVEVADIR